MILWKVEVQLRIFLYKNINQL